MFFQNINYVTVVIAAILGMVVGYIWYSPWAFGKLWMKSKGWTEESMREASKGKSMASSYALMTLSTLVTAFILAALFNSLVVTSIVGMIVVALCVWIGFIVPTKLGDLLFGGDTRTFFLISIGHGLVVAVVMSLVIGIWG